MKKQFNLIICILMIFILPLWTAFPVCAATPTIKISEATVKTGESVTLELSLHDNPGIASFTLGFEYDTSALTLTEVTLAEGIGGNIHFSKNAVWYSLSDSTFDGVWLHLTFSVTEEAQEGVYPVSVTYGSGNICNLEEEDVIFSVESGNITVGADTLYGDVNGDGEVDATDATLLTRYANKWAESTYADITHVEAGDVNGDAAVDATDATLLTRYANKWAESTYADAVKLIGQ